MLADLSLRNKFLLTTFASITLLGLATTFLAAPILKQKLYETLIARGISIAKSAAFNSEHYILQEEYLLLSLNLKDYQKGEPDILYIFATDRQHGIMAHTFTDGFPREFREINQVSLGVEHAIQHLLTEEGEVIDIAVPLLNGLPGDLHVGISGEKIKNDINSFMKLISGLIFATLLLGGAIAIVASRLITRPLLELSAAAQKVAGGDLSPRVAGASDDEIGQLIAVFNEMVAKRQQREQEREQLIAELHQALDEVRVLSGMLPICASCKKIRDDKGYWNQIESYIRDHSEAEFTHGICPDCIEQLYPEFAKDK